jgi:hypothetical protein
MAIRAPADRGTVWGLHWGMVAMANRDAGGLSRFGRAVGARTTRDPRIDSRAHDGLAGLSLLSRCGRVADMGVGCPHVSDLSGSGRVRVVRTIRGDMDGSV